MLTPIKGMILDKMRVSKAGVKPLAWIPNTPGFKFIGVTKNAEEIDCVIKLVDGKPIFKELRYWRKI